MHTRGMRPPQVTPIQTQSFLINAVGEWGRAEPLRTGWQGVSGGS